jgi:DNA-binding LacI/PurR family transcriptional regulator
MTPYLDGMRSNNAAAIVAALRFTRKNGCTETGAQLRLQSHEKGLANRIGFISGQEDSSTTQEREKGFTEELTRQNQSLFARSIGNYDFATAAQVTHLMFDLAEQPDALFVANDHMAFAVLDTIRNTFGLRIPDDVQAIGFDNVPQSS